MGFRKFKNVKYKNNKLPGIYYRESKQKYNVSIKINDYNHYIGRFDNYFDACCALKSFHQKIGISEKVKVKPGDFVKYNGEKLVVNEVLASDSLSKEFISAYRLHHGKPLTRTVIKCGYDWTFA